MPAFVPAGACWICGADDLAPVHESLFEFAAYRDQDPALSTYTGATVTMLRCGRCGFTQPSMLPSLERYFARMYDQRWSREWVVREFESDTKTAIFADILSGLERRVTTGRRLLDVGAHVGKFIDMASRRGWTAEGIELNPTTASYARERTALPVHEQDLESLGRGPRRFDAVTLIDVLEHIPHPVKTLAGAARVLEPGGWIAVKVPSGPNQLRKERIRRALRMTPRVSVADNLVHVSHFSPASLRLALRSAGFDHVVLRVGRPERTESGSRPRALVANVVRAAAHVAARGIPGGLHSPLAFNLQAFARRADHT